VTTNEPPSHTPAADGQEAEQPVEQPLDTKARFREALERKRQRHAAGGSAGFDDSKVPGAHGAAGAKRVFRRKSG
jgi:hypothetical protein